jgi:hypothetical protein
VTSIGYTRIHRLDLGGQLLHLRALGIEGSVGQLRNGLLSFQYSAQPTPLSRTYDLHLTYRRGEKPETRVLSPNITALAEGHDTVPHLYEHDHPVKLCLYLPRTGEWGPEMSLARTIVPWAVDWLFHFEAWLAIGEWFGGGEHPRPQESKQASRGQQRSSWRR